MFSLSDLFQRTLDMGYDAADVSAALRHAADSGVVSASMDTAVDWLRDRLQSDVPSDRGAGADAGVGVGVGVGDGLAAPVPAPAECPHLALAKRVMALIGIGDVYLAPQHDRCYCRDCHGVVAAGTTKAVGVPAVSYPQDWKGRSLADAEGVSVRIALKTDEVVATAQSVFTRYHPSFHGTSKDKLRSIVVRVPSCRFRRVVLYVNAVVMLCAYCTCCVHDTCSKIESCCDRA